MLPVSLLLVLTCLCVAPPNSLADTSLSCHLPHNFLCHSGDCIAKDQQCDGITHCHDGSDESNCHGSTCDSPKHWRCNDGVCIFANNRCDGINECPDMSDEHYCDDHNPNESAERCGEGQFQCADNGRCIPGDLRCNGIDDCVDGSDEHCLEDKIPCQGFTCRNGKCIIKDWQCDGADDCDDGSDEENCVPPASKCNIDEGFYLCGDHITCIMSKKLCDRNYDCPDHSDEEGDCHVVEKHCDNLLKDKCSHACVQTPKGPVCTCPKGLHLKNSTFCGDVDECMRDHPCSQKCVNTYGSYHCECYPGFFLMQNNHSCRHQDEEPILIFSIKNDVRAFYLEKEEYFSVSGRVDEAVGVAYDGTHVYWAQLKKGSESIVRSFLNGSSPEVVVNNGVNEIEDISIDWLTGNIYFVDSNHSHIAVCTNDGIHCTIILSRNVYKPRAIEVYSNKGVLFWTDWSSNAHIGKANMDGTNSVRLVSEGVTWPNGLCIDYQTERIYWVDAKHAKIESIKLDGSDRKTILDQVFHPYWVDVYDNKIYWSEWYSMALFSANLETGKDKKVLIRANHVYGLQVYYPGRWNRTSHHSCVNSKCQLCLLKGTDGHTCACAEGKELARDGFSCQDAEKQSMLLIAGGAHFITVDDQALGKHIIHVKETTLPDITCIVYDQIRDRVIAYDDYRKAIYSIERYLEDNISIKILVDNDIGQIEDMDFDYRTNTLYWCDVYRGTIEVMNLETRSRATLMKEDSGDVAIDIALVPNYGYMFVAFRSSDGSIHISKVGMDGRGQLVVIEHGYEGPTIKMHYDQGEKIYITDSGTRRIDEMPINGLGKRMFRNLNRDPITVTSQADHVFWMNAWSQKLYWTRILDSDDPNNNRKIKMDLPERPYAMQIVTNSKANFDDHECMVSSLKPLQSHQYPCSDICVQSEHSHMKTHRCLCPKNMILNKDGKTCMAKESCNGDYFLCSVSNMCIEKSKRCNKIKDCYLNEDELGCSDVSRCNHDQYSCKSGQCIDRNYVCDKNPDCDDGSDEKDCAAESSDEKEEDKHCSGQQFRCSTGLCIDKQNECDGKADCPGEEDEDGCETKKCSEKQFTCASSMCIPKSWECDQKIDCNDGSDEHNSCGYRKPCDINSFRCANSRCIPIFEVCNGIDDCRDSSDEVHCTKQEDLLKEGKQCDDDEYNCASNITLCIPHESRCNGKNDCPKGEDEMGCHPCPHGQWECSWRDHDVSRMKKWHGQCIDREWLCDGSHDCMDGSDENKTMCDEFKKDPHTSYVEHNAHVIIMETKCKDAYRCRNGECLDFKLVCNGEQNCFDGSDEGGLCESSCLRNGICSQNCQSSPMGAICTCNPGFILADDGKTCHPAPPACSSSPCHQKCHDTPNHGFLCLCFEGYQLRLDKISCKAVDGPMTFVYLKDNKIMRYDPTSERVDELYSMTQVGGSVSGFDVYSAKESIFFSVKDLGEIHHLNLFTHNETVVKGLGSPTILSVDWVTENIYYVDAAEDNTRIRICHMDRQACATLKTLENPISALVVDPIGRLMFYITTVWTHDKRASSTVYKANLDGTHGEEIYRHDGHCTSMDIDYERRAIFIDLQQYQQIIRINYDGMYPFWFSTQRENFHPTSVQFFEDHLYAIGSNNSKLYRYDYIGVSNYSYASTHTPFQGASLMKVDQLNKQRKMKNPCDGNNCSSLCVSAPLGPKCVCPDGKGVEPNIDCDQSSDSQHTFSTISKNTPSVVPVKSSSRNVMAVLTIFAIVIITGGSFIYAKKCTHKRGLKDRFKVHFSSPSLQTIITPFTNFGAVATKFVNSRTGKNVGMEYENPLNISTWPKDVNDAKVEMNSCKVTLTCTPPQRKRLHNLLDDTDSDAESDREMVDDDFRDQTLLLP